MKGKKLVALLAAGTMVFSPAGMALGTPLEGVFASAVSAAEADEYLYYNEDTGAYEAREIPTTALPVTEDDQVWASGWYIVNQDIIIEDQRIFANGDVNLILMNDCTLTVDSGIRVFEDYSLTVYAQSNEDKMGTLIVKTNNDHVAGIGGNDEENSGKIIFHGGNIQISSGAGAGIGGGNEGSGTETIIYGGKYTINTTRGGAGIGGGSGYYETSGNILIYNGIFDIYASGGAGIGGGNGGTTGEITINGGYFDCEGSNGIGAGASEGVGTLIINGGEIIAKGHGGNGDSGSGIGGCNNYPVGRNNDNGQIYINGGKIQATSSNGSGIGDLGATIMISGGEVTAIGANDNYEGFAGIGSYEEDIYITGGTVSATGYNGAAGIGSNTDSQKINSISISGGTVKAVSISNNLEIGPGAGIGSSYLGNVDNITLSGGNVTAIGSSGGQYYYPSAGIGAGSKGTVGNIIISGGIITATGGDGGVYYPDGVAIGSYDGTSGTFSTVLPENGISTLGLLDDASSSRSGNAVVFANGYGSIDSPISDLSQQDSWGGLFFLNGEGMMLGQTVKPTDSFILPEGYSFTINQLQTLDLTNILMTLNNTGIYNNGTIINPEGKHLLLINNGGDNIGVIQPDPENPPADLTDLSDLVEEAKAAIASGQYTEDSIKELETLIETVENAETLTDEQVKTYISQIQTAMNTLKKPVDTSGIDQVISAFESRTDLDQYTDESVKAVNDLIAEYQSKTGLTQDEVDEYLSKIQTAIDGLRYEIDTTAIDREIKKFNEMTLTNYTAESVKAVRDVIDEYTRAIAAGENLSQNDVDQYLARIQEKVAALEWTSGEHYGGVYDQIRELIQQAYDMLNSGTHYLEDAVAAMNKVIQRAQQVLKIPDLDYRSEEAEIIVYLEDAIDNLENSIDNYYGLDMSAYTNLVRQAEQLEELGYHGPAYNDLWRMINNLPTHFADQAAVDAYVAQMDALLQQAIEENTTVPGGDVSDSVLVQSMIDYFQRIAASGDYTEASIHRVQALINSIPDTLTDEQARYYADLIYDAVMAMEPKGSSDPVYIEVPVSSGGSSTGSSSASSTQTGWVHNTNGSVYYKNGKVLTGWQTIDGDRYYFSKQGFMQTGWQVIDGSYYYFSANGVMLTGWQKYDTAWYYLDPDTGKMVADGLYEIDGKTYYFYDWGGMAYNFWYQTESGWYFFGGDGAMKKAGWIQWDGNYYYLTASGRMAVNTTTPNGYYVNANGIWNG